jgi:hypothetical protein
MQIVLSLKIHLNQIEKVQVETFLEVGFNWF